MTTTLTDVRCVAVPVRDQDAALAFYVDRLGFEKRLDAPISDTMRWIEVAPPGAATSIALVLGRRQPSARGRHRRTVRRRAMPRPSTGAMRDRGVAVGELLAWPDVPPMFTFDDPDGNRFYVVAEP